MRSLIAVALASLAAGCASTGGVPRPFPGAPAPATSGAATPPPVLAPDPARIVETALAFRGVPYRTGGSDPAGFDCSGFVQYVFAQHGTGLPREVREQIGFGHDVPLAGIAPGDLIFFATTSAAPSHVGISIGGDEFVHAPSSRGVVRVERFSNPYWARRIVGVRRLSSGGT